MTAAPSSPSLPSILQAAIFASESAQYVRIRSDVAGNRISKYSSLPRFCFRAAMIASLIA